MQGHPQVVFAWTFLHFDNGVKIHRSLMDVSRYSGCHRAFYSGCFWLMGWKKQMAFWVLAVDLVVVVTKLPSRLLCHAR